MEDSGLSWHYTAASGSLSIKEKNRDSVPHEILSSSPKGRQREHERERVQDIQIMEQEKAQALLVGAAFTLTERGTKVKHTQGQPGTRENQGLEHAGSARDQGKSRPSTHRIRDGPRGNRGLVHRFSQGSEPD